MEVPAMTDIVERLRAAISETRPLVMCEAADEIELLRDTLKRHAGDVKSAMQEIERLTAALDACADYGDKQVAEIERLRLALKTCRELRAYDRADLVRVGLRKPGNISDA
jgi:hypothetical protein